MNKCLSGLGIGLSLVFGCLFLALVAELYYVFWWKRRLNRDASEDEYIGSQRELFYLFCPRKPFSLRSAALNPPHRSCFPLKNPPAYSLEVEIQHSVSRKDAFIKPLGEEGIESELIRAHDLSGPPRFLFTIKEETREDLESEDGNSRKSIKGSSAKSLSDFFVAAIDNNTPFGTPLSSPPFFTPPLTPREQNHQLNLSFSSGFNPLFEFRIDGEELNGSTPSPPPKFKFLRDAEEKLCRRMIEDQNSAQTNSGVLAGEVIRKINDCYGLVSGEKTNNHNHFRGLSSKEEESFLTIVVNKNTEGQTQQIQNIPSVSSRVLPLRSSPPENTNPGNRKLAFP